MKKVEITLKINDYFIETIGIKDINLLSFFDDNSKVNFCFDLKNLELTRENEEFISKMTFSTEKGLLEYCLKKEEIILHNNFTIKQLLKENKKVIIKYQIQEEVFNFELTYKEEVK